MKIVLSFVMLMLFSMVSKSQDNIDLDSAIQHTTDDSTRFKYLIRAVYTNQYSDKPNFIKADRYYNEALKIANDNNWTWAKYKCFRVQASSGTLHGDYFMALKYDKLSYQISKELDSTKVPLILSDIADDYLHLGNYWLSNEYLKIAMSVSHEKTIDISLITLNLGILYREQKLFDISERYISNALSISKSIKDQEGIVFGYSDLADLYIRKNKNKLAINILNQALQIAKDNDYTQIMAEVHFNLAKAYYQEDDIVKANEYVNIALRYHENTSNYYGQASTLIYMAHMNRSDRKLSKAYLKRATKLCNDVNSEFLKLDILKEEMELADVVGDYGTSIKLRNEYFSTAESLNQQYWQQNIDYENEKNLIYKKESVKDVKPESVVVEPKETGNVAYAYVATAFILAATLLLYFKKRKNKQLTNGR